MPEIWIPYGDVEISVDINAENLSGIFKTEDNPFDIDDLNNNKLFTNIEDFTGEPNISKNKQNII